MKSTGSRIRNRNQLLKQFIALLICSLLFPSSTLAGNFTPLEKSSNGASPNFLTGLSLSGYFETGERSQAEDFEEEEDDREYSYQKYHLKLEHKLSGRFNYRLGSFIYDKDYKSTDSLDNTSRIFKAGGSYYLFKQKQKSLKLDIELKYKEKRYEDSPSDEYDQVMLLPALSYNKKSSYSIKLSTGVNSYDYLSTGGNDQLRFFSKLGAKKYLLQKKLVIAASYKFDTATRKRADKRKNKNDFMLGFDYIFAIPFIHKITARAGIGQRDTKDDDERDEDFDYRYVRFYIKTEHRLNPKIKSIYRYQYFKKDYLTADLDHSGFYISSKFRYKMLADETRELYFNFNTKHKEVDYDLKSGSDYDKETLEIKGTYRKKKDWKTSVSLQGSFYDFKGSARDRNRYYVRFYFNKLFPSKDIVLSLSSKYKYTDNREANDTEEKSLRLAFTYKF